MRFPNLYHNQIGNPLNDGEWTYTWQNGRQLANMTNGETTASFVYNENGLRVQKNVNGVVTNYTLHGKNVVHMAQGNDELHFFYDAQNKPAVAVYNGTTYSYVKNLQGDVVAILDANGAVVVSYVYDAWGRHISKIGSMAAMLGTVQPFRYRGYVYDGEMEVYYLRSRYFDGDMCRFLSSDVLYNGNLFCYCADNPVVFHDASGKVLQCCYDDNGMRCTFSTMVMSGGFGGGSIALPGMNRDDGKKPDLTDRIVALDIYNHYTNITVVSEGNSAIHVKINFEKWLQTNDRSKWNVSVSDWLAYFVSIELRNKYGIENVDLKQMSAEFHGHALLDVPSRFFNGSDDEENQSTDAFDIDIYQDGRVIDPKPCRQFLFELVDVFTIEFSAD